MKPDISVIIVSRNDKRRLLDCLASIEGQTVPSHRREIIVVDDGSTDGTAGAVRAAHPGVRVVEKSWSGADISRNAGVREAAGRIVAFIDSDCVAPAEWLAGLERSLAEEGAAIVGGRIIHRGNLWARLIGISDFGEFQGLERAEVSNIPTCNMGLQRAAFEGGGFDPRLPVAGDVAFCHGRKLAGTRLLYDPSVVVFHRPTASLGAFLGRAYRYGEGFVRARRARPELPWAGFVRAGVPGVIAVSLGRVLLDWRRLFRHRREAAIRLWEIPAAVFLLLVKRLVSVAGALRGYFAREAP